MKGRTQKNTLFSDFAFKRDLSACSFFNRFPVKEQKTKSKKGGGKRPSFPAFFLFQSKTKPDISHAFNTGHLDVLSTYGRPSSRLPSLRNSTPSVVACPTAWQAGNNQAPFNLRFGWPYA